MRHFLILLIGFMTLSACEGELGIELPFSGGNTRSYVIKAGRHTSEHSVGLFEDRKLSFSAAFDSTAIYHTELEENQLDINKLMGFSTCGSHHHENSARFGWRWAKGQLEIHAYAYVDGTRVTRFVGTVALDTYNDYTIEIQPDKYIFTLNDDVTVKVDKHNCTTGTNYMLYPYFGGDETAPHDIVINISVD